MAAAWSEYQEEAAEFYRSLGLEATTNVTIKGVRTSHDVDVLVKSRHAGFEVTWIVECKHWKSPVSKLHVLGLREIVTDTGADRGILLAENGFQSGATEAAALTNVHLTSLSASRLEASFEVFAMRLAELHDRIEECRERYWNIPKKIRIEFGLRHDIGEDGYSGAAVISLVEEVLRKAFRGHYPFEVDFMVMYAARGRSPVFGSVKETVSFLEPMVHELVSKLDSCTAAMTANT